MPTYGLHLTDGSELQKVFLAHVGRHYRGKPGPYLLVLVERDLMQSEAAPSPLAPDVLEALTRLLCGHARGLRMRAALAGQDQVLALTDLLEEYLARLDRPLGAYPQKQDDGPAAMAAEAPAPPRAADSARNLAR